jgi:hypothetical protein
VSHTPSGTTGEIFYSRARLLRLWQMSAGGEILRELTETGCVHDGNPDSCGTVLMDKRPEHLFHCVHLLLFVGFEIIEESQ